VLVFFLLVLFTSSNVQAISFKCTVNGYVRTQQNDPVANCEVKIVDAANQNVKYTTTTDAGGYYHFDSVATAGTSVPGKYQVVADKIGFGTGSSDAFSVLGGQTYTKNVVLKSEVNIITPTPTARPTDPPTPTPTARPTDPPTPTPAPRQSPVPYTYDLELPHIKNGSDNGTFVNIDTGLTVQQYNGDYLYVLTPSGISIIDTSTNKVISKILLDKSRYYRDFVVSKDNSRIYIVFSPSVTVPSTGVVKGTDKTYMDVIDVQKGQVVASTYKGVIVNEGVPDENGDDYLYIEYSDGYFNGTFINMVINEEGQIFILTTTRLYIYDMQKNECVCFYTQASSNMVIVDPYLYLYNTADGGFKRMEYVGNELLVWDSPVDVGNFFAFTVSRDQRYLYATPAMKGYPYWIYPYIYIYDTNDLFSTSTFNGALARIETPYNCTYLVMSPDNSRIYALCWGQPSTSGYYDEETSTAMFDLGPSAFLAYDTKTNTNVDPQNSAFSTDSSPVDMVLTSDSKTLYTANKYSSSLTVYDTKNLKFGKSAITLDEGQVMLKIVKKPETPIFVNNSGTVVVSDSINIHNITVDNVANQSITRYMKFNNSSTPTPTKTMPVSNKPMPGFDPVIVSASLFAAYMIRRRRD
jgi:hypothetical protein